MLEFNFTTGSKAADLKLISKSPKKSIWIGSLTALTFSRFMRTQISWKRRFLHVFTCTTSCSVPSSLLSHTCRPLLLLYTCYYPPSSPLPLSFSPLTALLSLLSSVPPEQAPPTSSSFNAPRVQPTLGQHTSHSLAAIATAQISPTCTLRSAKHAKK